MTIHQFPDRWRYPLPDMTDARNRRAWESLIDFGLRSTAPPADDREGTHNVRTLGKKRLAKPAESLA